MKLQKKNGGGTWRTPRMLLLYMMAAVFTITQIGSGLTGAILPLHLLGLGISLSMVGLLYSILNLLSGLVRTPVGIVSDITGPRTFVLTGFLVSIGALLCMFMAWDWKLATIAMILAGLASGIFFPMMKRIAADEADAIDRVKAFTVISLIFSSIGIIGPAISGITVEAYGLRSAFFIALILGLLGPLICYRMVFTPPPQDAGRVKVGDILTSTRSLGRKAVLLGISNFFRTMTWGVSSAFIPVYLQETFRLTYSELGFYVSLSGISAFVGAPIASRFATFNMRSKFTMLAQPILLPLYIFLTLAGRVEMAFVALLAINLLGSMTGPMIDTLIGDIAPPDKIGSAYGFVDTFMRVGIAVGNIIGGYAAEHLGFQAVFIISGLAASSTSVPMFLLRRHMRRNHDSLP